MRAAILREIRHPLVIEDWPDPDCPQDGVVLKILASGVCRSDWHAWSGGDPVRLPHIPGHEYCGEVIETGDHVRRWMIGDHVIAPFILACGTCPDCAQGNQTICSDQVLPGFTTHGSFAERLAVPHADHNLTRVPEGMPATIAATLGCRVTTAWHALTGRVGLRPGEWLTIFGTGGIGTSALILAKGLGAKVAVVDIVPEKLEHAKMLGADVAINGVETDPVAAVREVTNGGADVALEALGIPVTIKNALKSLRKLGRMVQVGLPTGDHATMPIPMDAVYSGQLTLYGTRGMPAWRYPSLLQFIDGAQLDLSPIVRSEVALSDVSAELAAFDKPAPPGIAVVTDFTT